MTCVCVHSVHTPVTVALSLTLNMYKKLYFDSIHLVTKVPGTCLFLKICIHMYMCRNAQYSKKSFYYWLPVVPGVLEFYKIFFLRADERDC